MMPNPIEDRVEKPVDELPPATYFAYGGWIIALVLAITLYLRIKLGPYGWMFTLQLVAVFIAMALYITVTLFRNSSAGKSLWRHVRSMFVAWRQAGSTLMSAMPSSVSLHFGANGAPGRRIFSLSRRDAWARMVGLFAKLWDSTVVLSIQSADLERPPRDRSWSAHTIAAAFGAVGGVGTLMYLATALTILFLDHRRFLFVIALLQALAIIALQPSTKKHRFGWLFALSLVTWALGSGLSYTNLGDWLANLSPSSGLAVAAFLFSFCLSLVELSNGEVASRSRWHRVIAIFAVLAFLLFALRMDGFSWEWAPLHRSYFADVAQYVKDGHWLLWDVPSLYGFLSIATLAALPGNGWQATYELSAVFLVAEAFATFIILRWNRSGWSNAAFAILFPLATIFGDSIARFPWSNRLYPQGGLRFFWVVSLLFVIFLMYVWRERKPTVVLLRWIGNVLWAVSLFWAIECAVWSTVIWVPYLILDALTAERWARGFGDALKLLASRFWPLAVLPTLGFLAITTFYRVRLGVAPDWRSYAEFTAFFTSGKVRAIFHVQGLGAGWTILLVLIAIGSLCIVALRQSRWDLFRLLMGTWLAVWGTASYFAVEPLDFYVALLLAVSAPACAIVVFCSRELHGRSATAACARLSIAPIAIIAIALLIGEPSRIGAMDFPFSRGWTFDVVQSFQPIGGELAGLISRAGISPTTPVLVPNGGFWTEPDQGLIQPFVRDSQGKVVEYKSWLPNSPVSAQMLYNMLPPSRQHTYIERTLAAARRGGWYITYRARARCETLSSNLHTVRTLSSPNFSASLCAYVPTQNARDR